MQTQEMTELIRINGQNSETTTDLIAKLTTQKDWDKIYQISEFFGQEISILVDAEEQIFVDWGSISRVNLTPPMAQCCHSNCGYILIQEIKHSGA